jgi:hypothetical protein
MNLYPIIVDGATHYELYPETMYEKTVDITSVFKESFSNSAIQRSIKYLQDTVHETLYTSDIQYNKTIKSNSVKKLLNNICKNGVLPIHNYIEDTLRTCNYNNWLKQHSIDEILSLAKDYQTPNKIMIFNETKQTAIDLNDLTESDKNDTLYFIATRLNNNITETATGTFIMSIDDMLANSKKIKENEIVVDYATTNRIKNYVMDNIITDVCGNMVSDIYDYGTYFDVSTDVTHSNDANLINANSYFIRSSIVINKTEYDAINVLTGGDYTLMYKTGIYVLIKAGKPFLITTVPVLETYDTSYNDCKVIIHHGKTPALLLLPHLLLVLFVSVLSTLSHSISARSVEFYKNRRVVTQNF